MKAVNILLNHNAEIDAVDEFGETALTLACSRRKHHHGVINALLHAGADVAARKHMSCTALHLAAASDQEGK